MVPLTTRQDALRFPGTVLIEPDRGNGLQRASVALVFQLAAIDRRFVRVRLGMIDQANLDSVWSAFDEITARE